MISDKIKRIMLINKLSKTHQNNEWIAVPLRPYFTRDTESEEREYVKIIDPSKGKYIFRQQTNTGDSKFVTTAVYEKNVIYKAYAWELFKEYSKLASETTYKDGRGVKINRFGG